MKIGIVSLVLGACALLTALTHFWLGPLSPPPTLEQTVAEKAASVREAALAGLRGQPLPDSARSTLRWDADKVVWGATATLGGLALVLGLAGWSRDGKLNRGCVGGAVLGGLAIEPIAQNHITQKALWRNSKKTPVIDSFVGCMNRLAVNQSQM